MSFYMLWLVIYVTTLLPFFRNIFLAFILIGQLEDTIGNRLRERGSDMQQRAPGRDSNLGLLQWGQSLCTWDACSTDGAPLCPFFVRKQTKRWFWTVSPFKNRFSFPQHKGHCRVTSFRRCIRLQFPGFARNSCSGLHQLFTSVAPSSAWPH